MCYIETTKAVTFYVIYDVGDGTSPLQAEFEHFEAGRELDVDIYDTDGEAVCIQFPRGEIVVGVWKEPVMFDLPAARSGPRG